MPNVERSFAPLINLILQEEGFLNNLFHYFHVKDEESKELTSSSNVDLLVAVASYHNLFFVSFKFQIEKEVENSQEVILRGPTLARSMLRSFITLSCAKSVYELAFAKKQKHMPLLNIKKIDISSDKKKEKLHQKCSQFLTTVFALDVPAEIAIICALTSNSFSKLSESSILLNSYSKNAPQQLSVSICLMLYTIGPLFINRSENSTFAMKFLQTLANGGTFAESMSEYNYLLDKKHRLMYENFAVEVINKGTSQISDFDTQKLNLKPFGTWKRLYRLLSLNLSEIFMLHKDLKNALDEVETLKETLGSSGSAVKRLEGTKSAPEAVYHSSDRKKSYSQLYRY